MPELNTQNHTQRGNVAVIVLALVVVIALGAGAYMYKDQLGPKPADAADQAEAGQEQAASASSFEIKDGDPTVAKIGKKEIKRSDVVEFIAQAMPNTHQIQPQIFTMATVQLVNTQIIEDKAEQAKLDNDPEVKKQLEAAKEQIIRAAFVQKKIDEKLTEDRIKAAYDSYKQNFPDVMERKSRHILVTDENVAKEVLKKLKSGEDFVALAKEYSIDPTKEQGGQLGRYLAQGDQVMPEYLEALYSVKPGTLIEKPIKSSAGFHIVEVQDERKREAPTYEEAKPFIAAQLRGVVMEEIMQGWRQEAGVEVFDINGNAFEPAAGEETPAVEAAPEAAPEAAAEAAE